MAKVPSSTPTIRNKRASFNFEILEKVEAGLVLTGSEVKSLRAGRASLEEAFAVIRDGEMVLRGCDISPYPMATYNQHTPKRERKLLLHRRQISKWESKVTLRGLTLVPLDLYFNDRGIVKCTLALARGKVQADKRETIRQRDEKRRIDRLMRGR